ncbi:hypothetical protein NHQ30_010317 [Ciborinia camelliae]|nr:hypothetical protein NHQ30_010317 [Ciborinia camelliae]
MANSITSNTTILPVNSPNMTSPKPPPAPVIAAIVPETLIMSSKPIGRKTSSVFFKQPISNGGSAADKVNNNNDRSLLMSVEGNMILDIGGLEAATTQRHKSLPTLNIPEFSLPEPASICAAAGHKRKNMGPADLSDNDGDESVGFKGIKRRPLAAMKLLPTCAAKEGKPAKLRKKTSRHNANATVLAWLDEQKKIHAHGQAVAGAKPIVPRKKGKSVAFGETAVIPTINMMESLNLDNDDHIMVDRPSQSE